MALIVFGDKLLFQDGTASLVLLDCCGRASISRKLPEILRRQQEAVRLTKRASLGDLGELRIGFSGSATAAFLAALVQDYRRRFPDVGIKAARTDDH